MKNNFFYSESGLSASMLFNKLCETARIYSNYERIIKYTYRVNARVYSSVFFNFFNSLRNKKNQAAERRLGNPGLYKRNKSTIV